MSNRKKLKLPKFLSEEQERVFWHKHDSTNYVDWSGARFVTFPNLRTATAAISLRLPQGLLGIIRAEANRQDVPYQSLMKMWLAEKADEVRRHPRKHAAAKTT